MGAVRTNTLSPETLGKETADTGLGNPGGVTEQSGDR
jgi:hypothetical protein